MIEVTDMFCGAGGSSRGASDVPGVQIKTALNHWKRAIETHNTNFPDTLHECTDISAVDPRRYPHTDILIASPECFPAGTLILTDQGLTPIEEVQIGMSVLTHVGRWRQVTNVMTTTKDTVIVKGQGHPGLEVSAEHPFYVRRQTQKWNNAKRDYDRHVLSDPEWMPAACLADGKGKNRWATPVFFNSRHVPEVPERAMPLWNTDFWWLVGRWLGDGIVRTKGNRGDISIVCGNHKADALEERLSVWLPRGKRSGPNELNWKRRQIRTATIFECSHHGLANWLVEHFGKLAHGKTLPTWALTLPEEHRRALLDGYVSADGSKGARATTITTVSKRLAVGVRLLAESLGFRVGLSRFVQHNRIIEGRRVNARDSWVLRWENNASQREAVVHENHCWSLVKSVTPGRASVEVFNLSVKEDESYVADGIVVHNCTNHSLAKGVKRVGGYTVDLFGNPILNPEDERSRATMWDVVRFAEFHQYQAIIVENVVDARRWILFEAWLQAMHALGYEHQAVYLNSMFAHPTPQSRDRMYVIFWRSGNKRPNLRIEPRAHCQHCGRDVDAQQSWKNGKTWGKYGKRNQYIYTCPTCRREVMPYYYCAANAIDWNNVGQRIGDRKTPLKARTLERIEYGLKKFGARAMMLHTNHAGGNRVRTPDDVLPTQDARQALAMLIPLILSANAGKGDSSKYVVRSAEDALPTQTASGQPSIVMPFLASTNYFSDRPVAADEPMPTQTTAGKLGVVMPFILTHGKSFSTKEVTDALSTIVGGGNHHFLVEFYNTSKVREITDALGSVMTVPHHGLVQAETPAIEDCYFRMLTPAEIKAGMAFPDNYVITGNQREQIKQSGNAVTPPAMRELMARVVETLQ